MHLEDKMVKFGESGSMVDWESLRGREVSDLVAMLCFLTWDGVYSSVIIHQGVQKWLGCFSACILYFHLKSLLKQNIDFYPSAQH